MGLEGVNYSSVLERQLFLRARNGQMLVRPGGVSGPLDEAGLVHILLHLSRNFRGGHCNPR